MVCVKKRNTHNYNFKQTTTHLRFSVLMKGNLNLLWYRCFWTGVTRRGISVQHVVYSGTQGKQACSLEVVHEASLEYR